MSRLTVAQTQFFQSYIEEFSEVLLPRSMVGKTEAEVASAREAFVHSLNDANFVGSATTAEIRVASSLLVAGYLSEAIPHASIWSKKDDNLAVAFSQKGLAALFDIIVANGVGG